jgi:hypothetical protein
VPEPIEDVGRRAAREHGQVPGPSPAGD